VEYLTFSRPPIMLNLIEIELISILFCYT